MGRGAVMARIRKFEERKRAHEAFVALMGRNPTMRELADLFRVELNVARSYREACKSRYGYTFETEPSFWKSDYDPLPRVCELIYEKHKIYPTQSELALMYGVTRQRIEQVIRRFRERGVMIGLRGSTKIRWSREFIKKAESE
jgi:hypothetical protein